MKRAAVKIRNRVIHSIIDEANINTHARVINKEKEALNMRRRTVDFTCCHQLYLSGCDFDGDLFD